MQPYLYRYILGLIGGFLMASCEKNSDKAFVFNDLKIELISPVEGVANDTVTLTGQKFSVNPQENKVSLNGLAVVVVSASPTQLKILVPQKAVTGNFIIEVGKKRAISPDFTILDSPLPIITGFTPKSGKIGDQITVTGKFFGKDIKLNNVVLNGASCRLSAASETELKFFVPSGAGSGKLKVIVNARAGESEEIFEFIPLPPQVYLVARLAAIGFTVQGPGGFYSYGLFPLQPTEFINEGQTLSLRGRNFAPENYNNVVRMETQTGRRGNTGFGSDTLGIDFKVPFQATSGYLSTVNLGQEGFFTGFELQVRNTNTWRERKRLPFSPPLQGIYQWVVDNKVYILSKTTPEFWVYDGLTDTWERKADFGRTATGGGIDPNAVARTEAATFTINKKCYLIGGQFASEIDVWEYDPSKDLWLRKQNFAPDGFPFISLNDRNRVSFYLRNAKGWSLGEGAQERGYIGFNRGVLVNEELYPEIAANEARRIWVYNPADDRNFNRDVNNGRSTAWKEIGSQQTPALNNFFNVEIGAEPLRVGNKQYFAGFNTLYEFTNGGGSDDTNPENDTWAATTINLADNLEGTDIPGLPFSSVTRAIIFPSQDRLYAIYSQECLTPRPQEAPPENLPYGLVSAFFEIDPATGTGRRKANFAGETLINGKSIIAFTTIDNRVFVGAGQIVGRLNVLPTTPCGPSIRRSFWEYIK